MAKRNIKRRSAGFTLTEIMVTVGILAVLIFLAFPVMSYFNLSLKMNQLDAGARNIFVAAQNQMVALRASNDTSALSSAKAVTTKPSDFTGTNWTSSSLVYLSSSDSTQAAALTKLLPIGVLEPALAAGCFTIEFNPTTYRIYAVFYAEGSFSYNPASTPRDNSLRKNLDPKLGYYGGGILEMAGSATSLSAPLIALTNNDTLNISFRTNNVFSGTVDDATFFYGLTYTVVVSSISDPTKSVTFGNAQFSLDGIYGYKLTTPLDSLTGSRFKDICPAITPGDNIKITVTVSYSDANRVTLPSSASVTTNSLYAARSNSETSSEVVILNTRQLQNLEPTVSGITGITSAVQGANIDWSISGTEKFVPISNSSLISYNGNGLTISNLNVGVSSGDSGLFGNFQGTTLSNIMIVNPKISGGTNSGALAGRLTGTNTTVTNCGVYIADVSKAQNYTVSGLTHVGGLIGYTNTPVLITDSFAAPYSVSGASGTEGGLIGYVGAGNSNFYIARCYADTDKITGYAPKIGGLIGSNGGTNVTDSYALGNIKAVNSSYIGGLVGYSAGASYTNCYAATTFTANSGGTPYGFSGSNVTVTNSTCLKGTDFTNGTPTASVAAPIAYTSLVSWSGGTSFTPAIVSNSHPYSAALIAEGKPYPFPHLKTSHHYNDWPKNTSSSLGLTYYEVYSDGSYGYYAEDSTGSELLNTLTSSKGSVVNDGYVLITPSTLSSRSFTYQSSSSGTSSGTLSEPVNVSINGATYKRYTLPNAALNMNYASSGFYVYVTINGTDYWYNPHFAKSVVSGADSRPSFDGTVYIRSVRQLANLGNAYHQVYWASNFKFNQEIDINFNTYSTSLTFASSIGRDPSREYWEPGDWDDGFWGVGIPFRGSYDGGGYKVTINSYAINGKDSLFHTSYGTIKNLNLVTSNSFTIGYSNRYDYSTALLCTKNTGTIQNCSVTLGGNLDLACVTSGVFVAYNTGSISNCLVTTSTSVTVKGNSTSLTGGFVSINEGTITNCYVRPGTLSYSGLAIIGGNVGGFIYQNKGTVSDCSVTGTVTTHYTSSPGYQVAGFVHTNDKNSTITKCYANCKSTSQNAAGFAYQTGTGSLIQYCYSMGTVTGFQWQGGSASGFITNASNRVKDCYAAIQTNGYVTNTFSNGTNGTNCRYFQWSGCGTTTNGTASTLSDLNSSFSGGVWGSANTFVYRELFPLLPSNCPFPKISGLDHYGDWPSA